MRSKTIGVLVFVLVLSAPLGFALGSVQVSSQSARSLELRLELTGIRDIKDAGGKWAGLEVKDFVSVFDSSLGLYAPVRSYIVALPIGADVTCQVIDPEYYEIDPSALGGMAGGGSPANLGSKPAEIAAKGYMGNQLVASLRISPLVYDGVRGKLRVYTRFGVRFDFGTPALGEGPAGQDAGDAASYEATLQSALVNYEQGRKWRRRPAASLTASDYFSGAPSWVKIRIDTTGVYCITGRDLEALGVAAGSVSAQTLRLYAGTGLPLNESLLDSNPSWMRQVPVRVSRATGALAGSDSIIFYALGAHDWKDLYDKSFGPSEYNKSFYADFNCYWLTWGGTFQESPARMVEVDPPPCVGCSPYEPPSFLERIHMEQDNLRDAAVPAEDGWYWRPFLKGSVVSLFAKTTLPDISLPGRLKVRVLDYNLGECSGDCFRMIIRLNSSVIGDWVWDVSGPESPGFDLDTTATLANSGLQRIDLDMPRNPPDTMTCDICEKLYLAWYELTYWRRFAADRGALFFVAPDTTATVRYVIPGFTTGSLYVLDVTDQFAVRQLAGAQVSGGPAFSLAVLDTTTKGDFRRYAVVSPQAMRKPLGMSREDIANIRNQNGRAYLVITHKDLLVPAQTIADFHDGQVVTTDQVYDEFAWGVPDAAAIRDFLRWRLTHGTPVARVLLFGDASWDIKGYLAYGTFRNFVPTYERRFLPPTSNPYSTDDWLAYLEPAPGDPAGNCYWPTIPLSRIPASSREDGEEIVARILDYTTNPELGPWQNRIMLVADDDRIGASCPGDRSNDLHTIYAEELSDKAYPQVFDRTKVYLTEYPIESTGLKSLARKAFVKALNEGALVTNFVGHGDEYRLAQEEVFNPASVNLVAAGEKLTLFIAASCNVSRFDGPVGSSMAEELFGRREGGAIASLASTHLCYPGPNQMLNMNFIFALFDSTRSKHPTAYIADALQVAKVRTVAPPSGIQSFWTNDEMYALFGDPAQRLASPKLDVVINKPASDTLERRSPYHFTATVRDGGVAVPSYDGTADTQMREAEKSDGYSTCQGGHLDYDLPGREIYRGKGDVQNGALAFDALVPVDAREGVRGTVRCFVSDGENSGSGLLDSLVIQGESASTDNVGPEIRLKAAGRELASGDSIVVGEHLTLEMVDESGVAIKAKSIFIPAVSVLIDDGERQDITDSVYAVDGDFTQSVAHFDVPSLTIDSHEFAITAFDNNNNVTTEEYTLLVGSSGGQVGNVVYAYPNPAAEFCYVICECDRRVAVDVAIFTVSGRKIWEQASPDVRSYHQIRWDGADTEGDRVANGTYLVKVEAKDPMESSFKFSKTIAVALIR